MRLENNRLYWDDNSPLQIVGCGGPEGFLYQPSLAISRINKLISNGGNSLYTIAVRSHGGDGTPTENPFINNDPSQGIDDSVISGWVPWFDLCLANNIVIYLMLYDDSTNTWGDRSSSNLSIDETNFIDALIEKFGSYENVIWGYAEEADSTFNDNRITAGVSYIRSKTTQLIAIHQDPSNIPGEYGQDIFAVQIGNVNDSTNNLNYNAINNNVLTARVNSTTRHTGAWEIHPKHGGISVEATRRVTWAALMGGGSVMALRWDITNTDVLELRQARYAQLFFESSPLDLMMPDNTIRANDTNYVLTDNNSYILYGADASILGLAFVNAGDYSLNWLDTISGEIQTLDVTLNAGSVSFNKPASFGADAALLIRSPNASVKVKATLTATESSSTPGVKARLTDDYHVGLRQIRSTKTYFSTEILPRLSGSVKQKVVVDIYNHLVSVHKDLASGSSITATMIGKQNKARVEHSDVNYNYDSVISSIIYNMEQLHTYSASIVDFSDVSASVSSSDVDEIRIRVNNLLGDL